MSQVLTNQYSLVLLTILPYVSNFSDRLGLSDNSPLTTNQVARFTPFSGGEVGGYLILKDGAEFWFEHGFVSGYRTPKSYYDLQDPKEVKRFFGPLNLDKGAAIQKARTTLVKLGYDLKEIYADQSPEVEMPPRSGTNIISYYSIRWQDPIERRPGVVIDLSGVDGTIGKIRFYSSIFWRTPLSPNHDSNGAVTPEREVDPKRVLWDRIFIDEGTALGNKLQLPWGLPLSQSSIRLIDYGGSGNTASAQLTNGYWLYANQGVVRGFSAPDSIYSTSKHPEGRKRLPITSYLGSWNMTTNEAIALARDTIRRAELHTQGLDIERNPDFISIKEQVGNRVIPRYYFVWKNVASRQGSKPPYYCEVEINASTKAVIFLYVEDSRRSREM